MITARLSLRCVLAAGVLAGTLDVDPAPAQAPSLDPALAAATFDTAWATIERTHYDPDYNGVDWHAVRAELHPRVAAVDDAKDLRTVLEEMVGRLGQSHFAIIPFETYAAMEAVAGGEEPTAGEGELGLQLRLIGREFVVTAVSPGGPADRAGVRPGWAVDRIGALTTAEVLAAVDGLPAAIGERPRAMRAYFALSRRLNGAPGEHVQVRFRDGHDRPVTREMVREPAQGELAALPGLPPRHVWLESERVRAPKGAEVGVIRFNLWAPSLASAFDRALDGMRDADGIVVDLRGNPGGQAFMPSGVSGHFFAERTVLGVMTTRQGQWRIAANPRRVAPDGRTVEPYVGPVAVLLDPHSASASEFLAGGMQAVGRARVFGETSAGAVLPSLTRRLPNGDVLQYAVGDFVTPSGRRFEGSGVVPDLAVPPTRAALLAGRDPALEAALHWIAEQKGSGETR